METNSLYVKHQWCTLYGRLWYAILKRICDLVTQSIIYNKQGFDNKSNFDSSSDIYRFDKNGNLRVSISVRTGCNMKKKM